MASGVDIEGAKRPTTPGQAWAQLRAGNERFVAGRPHHPNQDADRRNRLTTGQQPFATLFGCSDSRVAAEVIFDQGLGDLFVIRTAGHVIGPSALGSVEFGSAVLQTPLAIVLGHESCGAVSATIDAYTSGEMPGGFLRDLVEGMILSVNAAYRRGTTSAAEVVREHVRQTVDLIEQRSRVVAGRIEDGRLAIAGLVYNLADGEAHVVSVLGHVDGLESARAL